MVSVCLLAPMLVGLMHHSPAKRMLSRIPCSRSPRLQLNFFNATALIEDAVRTATGNEDYEFGDWTRGAIKDLSGKDADDYQFGDITRKVLGDAAGKDADEYQFGDITRKVLGDADRVLADARDAYFEELPTALWRQLFGGLSQPQRQDLIVSLVQLVVTFVLSFSFVMNGSMAVTIAIAWAASCSGSGLSPLATSVEWARFLTTHSTLRLAVDLPLLPVQALVALVLSRYFRRATAFLQRALPLRKQQLVLNRALSYGIAWLLINILSCAALACLGIGLASAVTRVPIFVR